MSQFFYELLTNVIVFYSKNYAILNLWTFSTCLKRWLLIPGIRVDQKVIGFVLIYYKCQN